jgi:hypothetical protein
MYQPWLRGCLLLLVTYSSAYVVPGGIVQPKSKLAWRTARRPSSIQVSTMGAKKQKMCETL